MYCIVLSGRLLKHTIIGHLQQRQAEACICYHIYKKHSKYARRTRSLRNKSEPQNMANLLLSISMQYLTVVLIFLSKAYISM